MGASASVNETMMDSLADKNAETEKTVLHRKEFKVYFLGKPSLYQELLFSQKMTEVHWLSRAQYVYRNVTYLGLEFIKSGSLLATRNGRTDELDENSIFLIYPGSSGKIHTGHTGFCCKISIEIEGSLLPSLLQLSSWTEKDIIRNVHRERFLYLMDKFKHMEKRFDRNVCAENYFTVLELLRFLQNPEPPPSQDPRILLLPDYMKENLHRELPLSELAKFACCSESRLFREFKKHFHISPHQMLRTLRMTTAAKLLKTDFSSSIKEISLLCGYGNALNFSTEFRKYYNTSPTEFRKNPDS